MGAKSSGKVRHPVLPVYFNAINADIYERLQAEVPKGQLSAWVIEAIVMRQTFNTLIEMLAGHISSPQPSQEQNDISILNSGFEDFDA